MTDTTDAIYDALAAHTGLSDARNRAIAMRVADAISAHIEAREAAAAEAMLSSAEQHVRNRGAGWNHEADTGPPEDEAINSHFAYAASLLAEELRTLPLPAPDALTRALAQARAEGAELLAWLAAACCDLRCVDEPTPGGDDGDVGWVVIEHHMSAPKEREVGYGKTPQEAIRAAIRARGKE